MAKKSKETEAEQKAAETTAPMKTPANAGLTATEAEADANAKANTGEQLRQDARDELAEEPQREFAGQFLTTANFTAHTSERTGRAMVEIKPTGWVGPGFEILGSRVKELVTLLELIEDLPEQE